MATKYVFVSGGVVSGLGKGITAASLGRLLIIPSASDGITMGGVMSHSLAAALEL